MRFSDAKKLNAGDKVLIIEQGGKSPIYRQEEICNISIEDKDAFILCADGHLYHHTALKAISSVKS